MPYPAEQLYAVRVLAYVDPIETPFGISCGFKLLEVVGERVLRCAMHGWHRDGDGKPVMPIAVYNPEVPGTRW